VLLTGHLCRKGSLFVEWPATRGHFYWRHFYAWISALSAILLDCWTLVNCQDKKTKWHTTCKTEARIDEYSFFRAAILTNNVKQSFILR
jgi:hypothetical protein